MKKGLIICGYPGIGKSSIAGWNNCIDLESSYFSRDEKGFALCDEDWVTKYCKLAFDIARQGFTVLLSCHVMVRNKLKEIKDMKSNYFYPPVVIFCPRADMKEAWGIRLMKRYNETNLDKDFRALEGAMRSWNRNMIWMTEQNFPIYCPMSIDYDLRDYILQIRKKEGCDDEEIDSSLEQMAGVEGTRLDVPVVEENSDTSRNHSE